VAAGVLVLIQAGLGGLTVEEGLDEYLVAAHLGLAMLLLGLLIAIRRLASEPQGSFGAPPPSRDSKLRALSALTGLLILATIVAGGLVAGTEKEGTPGSDQVFGAHTACGEQFPTCVDRFLPFGVDRLIDIQLTHRVLMFATVLSVIALLVVALRRRASRAYLALAGLVAAQVLLGAANVWLGKHAGLIVGHLMLGTLVWATAVYATMTLIATSVEAPASMRRRETEAATA
jgi:heme A synthase